MLRDADLLHDVLWCVTWSLRLSVSLWNFISIGTSPRTQVLFSSWHGDSRYTVCRTGGPVGICNVCDVVMDLKEL